VYVLGLSALAHDPAAALLSDTGIAAAIEESKLLRQRHATGIPREAIRYCLERAGIAWRDVEWIALASRPRRAWLRHAWLRTRQAPRAPVASGYYQTKALGELGRELNNLRILAEMLEAPGARVVALDHHLCHAASAFYASPFDRAAILTLDEQGDGQAGLLAAGEGTRIRALRAIPFPHSLGWVYSQVTDLLGFRPREEEHKTQWLGLEGEPAMEKVFLAMLRGGREPFPRLDRSYFKQGLAGRIAFSEKFYHEAGLDTRRPAEWSPDVRRALAASLQRACAVIACGLAQWLRRETRGDALCLAGGLFLNPLLVEALERESGFARVFVQPAAGNPGCALGAAWLTWHDRLRRPRVAPMRDVYWGPRHASETVKQVLDNCKARYRLCSSETEKLEAALRLLAAGKIVAWHQGDAEFGPRALGHRSLLASPWAPFVLENLNEYVKHREAFRPFALAVPEEEAWRYFEASPAARFMASLARVRPEARELVRRFLLPGGRVRLHAVERAANPLLWRLLDAFGKGAPAPFLVNTSFNLFGEPLVVTPREAVRSFFCSGIDALVLGDFLLTKD
jgi:carbamoyltransferase